MKKFANQIIPHKTMPFNAICRIIIPICTIQPYNTIQQYDFIMECE